MLASSSKKLGRIQKSYPHPARSEHKETYDDESDHDQKKRDREIPHTYFHGSRPNRKQAHEKETYDENRDEIFLHVKLPSYNQMYLPFGSNVFLSEFSRNNLIFTVRTFVRILHDFDDVFL